MNPESPKNQLDLFIEKTPKKPESQLVGEQKEKDNPSLIPKDRLDYYRRKNEEDKIKNKIRGWQEERKRKEKEKRAMKIRCKLLQTTEEDLNY